MAFTIQLLLNHWVVNCSLLRVNLQSSLPDQTTKLFLVQVHHRKAITRLTMTQREVVSSTKETTVTHCDTLWHTMMQERQDLGWAGLWVASSPCDSGVWCEHHLVQQLEGTHLQRETKTLHWGNISNVRNQICGSRTRYWYDYNIYSLICQLENINVGRSVYKGRSSTK